MAQRGGCTSGNARREIGATTGKPVITPQNAVDFSQLIDGVAKTKKIDGPKQQALCRWHLGCLGRINKCKISPLVFPGASF